jgi:major type 1 subunit fimbrin (pilin)
MRKYLLPATIASAAILLSFSAAASDGTISFSGKIASATCTIDPGSAALTVTLPTLAVSAFQATAGTLAGITPFSLTATNCPGAVTSITTFFENNSNVDGTSGYLNNPAGAGQATGVALKLTNATGSTIDLSKSSGGQAVVAATVDGTGTAVAKFAVQYVSTSATVVPGNVNPTITYSMVYP